jgi:hypothetical protein
MVRYAKQALTAPSSPESSLLFAISLSTLRLTGNMLTRYTYSQNNSGGSFDKPKWTGPKHLGGVCSVYSHRKDEYDIFIMAESSEAADALVQVYSNVYFDGCTIGIDCNCCGDRWDRSW